MEQIGNVIVFGDSLSDIGHKWITATGRFARKFGLMTVNPSGRFSDCRNWTDFMYLDAAGIELVLGTPGDTIAASRVHLRLTANSRWLNQQIPPGKEFLYSNYAEGGACGSAPASLIGKETLGQFKDQVASFAADFRNLSQADRGRPTLFLIWFGANDLYTAGCKPEAMAGVAENVANRQREEIVRIAGAQNARFIFMNLARPEASVRYQDLLKKDESARNEIDNLRRGVDLYNARLLWYAGRNGDAVVDIASVVCPDVVSASLKALHLVNGAQPKGTSDHYIPAAVYDSPKLARRYIGDTNGTTSDKAHPTDRVYKLLWDNIRATILQRQYAFGLLGGS
jgi:phospholipase/lecithinase/hemolysin